MDIPVSMSEPLSTKGLWLLLRLMAPQPYFHLGDGTATTLDVLECPQFAWRTGKGWSQGGWEKGHCLGRGSTGSKVTTAVLPTLCHTCGESKLLPGSEVSN